MNIAFVTQEYPPASHGGIGTYTSTVANALSRAGHNIHVIALALDGPHEETNSLGVTVHRIEPRYVKLLWQRPFRFLALPERSPRLAAWLAWANAVRVKIMELDGDCGVDVVEAPDYLGQGLLATWPTKVAPIIARLHNPATIVYPDNGEYVTPDLRRAMRLERLFVERSDRIIGPSTAILQRLGVLWKLDGKPVDIIPYPVDTDLFSPSTNTLGTANEPTILYVGRMSEAKGVRCLLDAATIVLERYPAAQFHFVGIEAPHPELGYISYSQYVAQGNNRQSDRFYFHGRVSLNELVAHYHSASLCVVPSIGFENFPFACLEAMSCGCPVLATNVGGLPDIVIEGVTGRLVEPADHNALASAISEMLSSPGELSTMGEEGRRRVMQQYSIERVLDLQLEAYRAAIKA